MKLVLDLPAEWTVETASDGSYRAVSSSADGSRRVELHGAAFRVREENLLRWARVVIADEFGDEFEFVRDGNARTTLGWHARVSLVEREGGERRLYAFYDFLDYATYAEIRAERAVLEAREEELEALLLTARPDFSSDAIVAMIQLWQ